MTQGLRKNGYLEIKLNDDRTQAIATIYPPAPGGESVTAGEIVQRLKNIGVTYGIREQAIIEAIHQVDQTKRPLSAVVAQGTLPQDGTDAKIRYTLPLDLLSVPLPKRQDGSGQTDWFAIDPAKLVKADAELATIIPAQPGIPGKTLTWPIQNIVPKPGKHAGLSAGQNVRVSSDGLRISAELDGYAYLHSEQLNVLALHYVNADIAGIIQSFPHGLVCMENILQANIHAGSFVAVRGTATGSQIRAGSDVFLSHAQDCVVTAAGNVYVSGSMKNCTVKTRKKLFLTGNATLVGGSCCAMEGVEAVTLGAPDFTETEIIVGVDRFSEVRIVEVQEEITACEANIARISQTLKPFASLAAQETLTDDKRQLISMLQAQKRSQEARINELHNERRALNMTQKEKVVSAITASRTVYPGVWVKFREAALQVETPLENARFTEGGNGKWVQTDTLAKAA